MATKRYPIGTKIRFIATPSMSFSARQDNGKTGVVVDATLNRVCIFLPKSCNNDSDSPISWNTTWEHIEKMPTEGEQLYFTYPE